MIIKGMPKAKIVSAEEKEFKEKKKDLISKQSKNTKNKRIYFNKGNVVAPSGNRTSLFKEEVKDKSFRDRLAARMLVMGFEPYDIAKILRYDSHQLRKRIQEDEEFRQVIQGFEEELFGAIESKQKFLMKEALDKLSELLKSDSPEINLQCIDRVFRIHGKYIERTEDMTPVERKMTPEMAERLLEKGIEYLKLSKDPKLIEGKIIDIENNS